MNSATLSTPSSPAALHNAQAPALQQLWDSAVATFGVVFSARRQLQQFDEMRGLLREAHKCETTNAVRSAALRAKAFALID